MFRKNPNKDRLLRTSLNVQPAAVSTQLEKPPKLLQSTKRGTSGRCARPNRTEPQGAATRILCWARHWRHGWKRRRRGQ